MKRYLLSTLFSLIVSANFSMAQDFIFFGDSPTSVSYDPSWGFVNEPSFLEREGEKWPVEDTIVYAGFNSLRLHWRSEASGDWGMAVAEIGWPGHDVNTRDTLQFYCYTKVELESANLPLIIDEIRLVIRPEKISIFESVKDHLKDYANVYEGIVEEIIYLGEGTKYRVRTIQGESLIIKQQNISEEKIFEKGSHVKIGWHEKDTVLI